MKTLRKQAKRKSRRKAHQGTLVSVDHNPEASTNDGHEDRLKLYMRAAADLKSRGYTYQEIAPKIAEQFRLVAQPHFMTVARWCWKADETIDEEIKEIARHLRWDQWNELERMKNILMPIVCAEELEIRRWAVINGEKQPVFDEEAVAERLKACAEVVKIHARQAKLMNLDLGQAEVEKGGVSTLAEIQAWLIQRSASGALAAEREPIDVDGEVLEISSGIEPELAAARAKYEGTAV